MTSRVFVSYHLLIMNATARKTAEERREAVLAAALDAFARGGLHGTSTEDIARAARRARMATLRDDALRKAAQGITTLSEVIRVTRKNVTTQDLDSDVLPVRE